MKSKASPEQKMGLAPDMPETPREHLESKYECIHSSEGPYNELGENCKIIVIRDKENLTELRLISKFFLNI